MAAPLDNPQPSRDQDTAVADPAAQQARRFDHWIWEIEDRVADLEGEIRDRSLAGEDVGTQGFNLQKLELLLEIAREAKKRI